MKRVDIIYSIKTKYIKVELAMNTACARASMYTITRRPALGTYAHRRQYVKTAIVRPEFQNMKIKKNL